MSYLEAQDEDLSSLLSQTSLPEEFLRDPSYWMAAQEMETFLENAQRLAKDEGPLFQKIGHMVPTLRSWGVLDSVLRMMPKPQELLAQPQRFLPYFITPEPPVENVLKTDASVEFDLPISSELYPLTTNFLKSAFESLPVYAGRPLAQCSWSDIHVKMNWQSEQETMFDEDPGHTISPELLRSVVAQLEMHQKELEEKNRDLQAKNQELEMEMAAIDSGTKSIIKTSEEAPSFLSSPLHNLEFIQDGSIETLKSNLAKLSDYMVRAQQLVTMLVAQDRLSPAVKQAMKKIDWDRVKFQFPKTVSESRGILDQTQEKFKLEQPGVTHV